MKAKNVNESRRRNRKKNEIAIESRKNATCLNVNSNPKLKT